MNRLIRYPAPLPLFVAGILCLAAGPQETMRVVSVHHGDTTTCLTQEKHQIKVRLDAIDAPKPGQPFGQAAKKALPENIFGKDVVVVAKKKDKYGRTLGHVSVDGRDTNLEMLDEGMARHYKQFDKDKRHAEAEASARAVEKGLSSDGNAAPPWEWRKSQKQR